MKPFDRKQSLELDKATKAAESTDPARRKLGKVWKKRLEKKIWGEK
jgi:hypothetical protein